jgi:hypothetical protein
MDASGPFPQLTAHIEWFSRLGSSFGTKGSSSASRRPAGLDIHRSIGMKDARRVP